MEYVYSSQERDEVLNSLTEEQRTFLLETLKRGKKTIFSNEIAKGKGTYTGSDQELNQEILEWEFIDLLDSGEGNRFYKCECGMSLRYQYIVKNLQTGEIKKFGKNHFEFHTNIPVSIVRDIIKGFEKIDYELDEILYKVENGWDSSIVNKALKSEIELPIDIQKHLELSLPLLDKQINKIEKIIRDKKHDEWLKERSEVLNSKKQQTEARWTDTYKPVEVINKVEPKRLKFKPELASPLGEEIHQYIIQLIEQSGTISVLEICERMKAIPHNFMGYYSTGKPKAFAYVSMVMEQMVKQGVLKLDQADFDNRWYSVV